MMTDAEVRDLTIEILRGIRGELAESNQRLGRVESGLAETNRRLGQVEAGLGRLADRFDGLLEFAGDRYRDHERRLAAVERSVAELEGSRSG